VRKPNRHMKLKDLSPNKDNPRTVSPEKLAQLKKALAKFGSLDGVIYNRKTKQLVGGHQRTKLFEPETPITITKKYSKPTKSGTVAEGYFEVGTDRYPYREVYWDAAIEKAANIAANKGAGEWDTTKLSEWLKELNNFDAGLDIELTMFDDDEIKEMSGVIVKEHTRVSATGVDEDEVPEKVPPQSKLGEVYQLGSHRLLCGDSTKTTHVEKLMNGAKVDMVFTDPPYGIGIDGQKESKSLNPKHNRKAHDFRGWDSERPSPEVFGLILTLNVPTIIFGGNYFADLLPASRGWIYWGKGQDGQLTMSDGELAWTNLDKPLKAVTVNRASLQGSVHPTQKPIEVVEFCLSYAGEQNKVLDLFGGSGSTLIACEKTHRSCYMMEIDPHYVDVIIARWEKYTGQKAKLVSRINTQLKKAARQPANSHVEG